jgi:hypothetical protein
MKIGEVWQYKNIKNVTVRIIDIYSSEKLVNRGSIATDKIYVASEYVMPFSDGSRHADLAREHFVEAYLKLY